MKQDKLNEMSGSDKVNLSPDVIYVLEKAKKFSELSGGAFDVTVGPLVKAWGIGTENPRVPSKDEIDSLLRLIGYKDIFIDSNLIHREIPECKKFIACKGTVLLLPFYGS